MARPKLSDEVEALKRERILEAATELFHERGFRGTSIDAIAERLGVTKPFVYYYFDDKMALLRDICIRVIQSCLAVAERNASAPGSARDRFEKLISEFVDVVMLYPVSTAIYFREQPVLPAEFLAQSDQMQRLFDQTLAALIEEGVAEGSFKVRDVRMATLGIGGMVSWMYTWYREGGRLDPDRIRAGMTENALRVVGARRQSTSE